MADVDLLTNPMTTSGDVIYGGASGVPTALAKGSDGQVLTLASGLPSWAGAGSGATGQMNQVGSNQAVVQNTWKDGPSLSLAAGTYILMGTLTMLSGTASGAVLGARLSDGTNHLSSTERKAESAGGAPTLSLVVVGYVVVGSTTTWKLQGITSNASGATILAAASLNGSGNNASTLVALKIA